MLNSSKSEHPYFLCNYRIYIFGHWAKAVLRSGCSWWLSVNQDFDFHQKIGAFIACMNNLLKPSTFPLLLTSKQGDNALDSVRLSVRPSVQTGDHEQTNRCYQFHYLPALRSIITEKSKVLKGYSYRL